MSHIIWDWNGTLFDDIDAVVAATTAVFAPYGVEPMTRDSFRAMFRRPLWTAYEGVLGRPLHEGEWHQLDHGFHDHYHAIMDQYSLHQEALAALTAWSASGGSQSLLSMWQHDRLVPHIAELGIDGHFARVDGLPTGQAGGGHKADHMARHVDELGIAGSDVVVIGDTVDDAVAARRVGARAVLFTGGITSRSDLESVGVPVVDSLTDAIAIAQQR